jgi:hypothetical protein
MKKSNKSEQVNIEPTNFDLAVIEVVEYLSREAEKLNLNTDHVPNKKELLASIHISSPVWPLMVNHYRHVSVKPAKQIEIVKLLKEKYWINPDYIWNYPREKEMFLISGILDKAAEPDAPYGYSLPSSAKLLRRDLIKTLSELDKTKLALAEKTAECTSLTEDLTNMKLLVKQLTTAKNPDKKA